MGGGGEPQSGGLQLSSAFFRVKWPTRRPHCTQTVTKQLNPWPISSTSHVVISSKVVACTSQPVAFNGHPSTRGRLTGLRNKPQQKQTCQHLAVMYWQLVSLLMELFIDGENCSVCISGGFWQSRSHYGDSCNYMEVYKT